MAGEAAANAPKRQRAIRGVHAEAAAAAAARDNRRERPLLESLAELMGVPTRAAAEQLLLMSPEQRQRLRQDFAAQDAGGQAQPPPTPSDSQDTAPMSD